MPRSKRDKKISLTKTKKKGMELKDKLYNDVRKCVDDYARIFTFSVQNMRNNKLKDVRQEWRESRFFFGKNKVMALALGRSSSDEYAKNLHKISKKLRGQMGLLFTNEPEEKVLDWFNGFSEPDYARSGNKATQTVHIEAGPMSGFSHSMEPQLRQLGLPTALQKGIVTLLNDYKVCEKDEVLTPEQARILKLFSHQMATFHLTLESMWSKDTSKFQPCPKAHKEKGAGSKSIYIKPKQKEDDEDSVLDIDPDVENDENEDHNDEDDMNSDDEEDEDES